MNGPAATDVFISYKAEDRARLKPLVDALEAEGFAVWWDAHIGGGTNWHEDIEDHLNSAKCVIVAWSKRSISHDGHFVRDEARRAQRRGTYLAVDDRSTAGVDFLDDLVADRSLVGVGCSPPKFEGRREAFPRNPRSRS
jgi:hypothetical protein